MIEMIGPRIVVIGGGFSGCLVASHLVRQAEGPLRIVLLERGAVGCGPAYGTQEPGHLLNVPASGMSAFPDDPGHFLRWLKSDEGGAFVPRRRYADYIRWVLEDASAKAGPEVELRVVRDEAVDVLRGGNGLEVVLSSGDALSADRVVLALGNLRPRPPHPDLPGLGDRFIRDPWATGRLSAIGPDDSVLLVGMGLTMADVAVSLAGCGHRGPIVAFSRHGLLPQPHGKAAAVDPFPGPGPSGLTVLRVLRWIREQADWRGAMDALRPRVQELWQALSAQERRRFLRHARPFWDTHRHRLPPQVHALIQELQAKGQLRTMAAHLDTATATGMGARVMLRRRGGKAEALDVHWVVNCAGPEADPRKADEPLIASLLARGLARPAEFGLGFDADADGALLAQDGTAGEAIFTLGAWRKGRLWESVAVPELRVQAQALARRLLERAEVSR